MTMRAAATFDPRGVHAAIVLCMVVALSAGARRALGQPVVVHDTRGMIEQANWDDFANCYIGGAGTEGNGNESHDTQVADVVVLAARTRLTSITIDTLELVVPEAQTPAGGFLVEVFANLDGNHPAEAPAFSLVVPPEACTFDGLFAASTAITANLTVRTTWSMNLAGGGIVLEPGAWWFSVVPKNDGDPNGCVCRWVGSNACTGIARVHFRCGGIDHGNNYPCDGYPSGSNGHPDWTVNRVFTFPFFPGTMSMRIEGEVMGGGGGNGTPACAADFNGSGHVDVQDIFDFLSAWFAGSPSADFDRGGGVTVQDIFGFLSAWFAGC